MLAYSKPLNIKQMPKHGVFKFRKGDVLQRSIDDIQSEAPRKIFFDTAEMKATAHIKIVQSANLARGEFKH